jgi:hypothetical protein
MHRHRKAKVFWVLAGLSQSTLVVLGALAGVLFSLNPRLDAADPPRTPDPADFGAGLILAPAGGPRLPCAMCRR